eukprot:CAMPEP_0173193306 /NCGR_PEP_ID=MMETSP1141-20130122/13888_1 /TAXON_ID=483371 /ORGANISM="non described non described, Strain CCMP2298" /LENGTH=31 /DNA_ID= /DNA_START= /DNA_END= /DNA_ORIENTATION=
MAMPGSRAENAVVTEPSFLPPFLTLDVCQSV